MILPAVLRTANNLAVSRLQGNFKLPIGSFNQKHLPLIDLQVVFLTWAAETVPPLKQKHNT